MVHSLLLQVESEKMVELSKMHLLFQTLTVGDRVRVSFGKGKKQTFQGICIAKRNKGISSSFLLRNSLSGEGLEYRFFPYSNNLSEIDILEKKQPLVQYRRAKLYYLRLRTPKEYTVS
uniref:Ribosomal protein L19 n=1 Tax=Andalucia godoyi TaxID=505711 RepID=M4QKJ6_ANDGO|nr:ribosomal protein L19 [Andalucia godoyi]AGH23993.1 ribosomal protein L19 [Andalucia godoyi]